MEQQNHKRNDVIVVIKKAPPGQGVLEGNLHGITAVIRRIGTRPLPKFPGFVVQPVVDVHPRLKFKPFDKNEALSGYMALNIWSD